MENLHGPSTIKNTRENNTLQNLVFSIIRFIIDFVIIMVIIMDSHRKKSRRKVYNGPRVVKFIAAILSVCKYISKKLKLYKKRLGSIKILGQN